MVQRVVLCCVAVLLMGNSVLWGGGRPGRNVEKNLMIRGDEVIETMRPSEYRFPSTSATGPGDSIGFTTYDYGTNGSANHNLINYGDGGVSLGRMAASQPATPDRGTWYAYSSNGGTTWTPLTKVETNRVGWSNIDQFRLPAAGGIEVTVAHAGLEMNTHSQRGGGAWLSSSTGSTASATWPRLAVGGDLDVHVLAGAGNPPSAYVYTRTTDAGLSFSPVDLPVLTAFPPSADGWDIAAQGTKVAMVGTSQTAGSDIILQRSTDMGTTWTTQTIYDVAGTGELPVGQQQPQPDGSCSVIFDNAGNIHVTWGNFIAIGDSTNSPALFYSFDAGIMHWSSATNTRTLVSEAPVQDTSIVNLPGAPGRDGNFASQPDIGVDAANNLYVVFSSVVAEFDAAHNAYEHAYGCKSTNGGTTWSPAVDLTPGTGFDAAFPSLADLVDTHLYIVYNCDPLAGNAIQGTHPENQTAIMFLKVPVTALTGNVPDGSGLPGTYSLSQNYPNPFNPSTTISYAVPKGTHVRLVVYNALGQEVATLVDGYRTAGTYEAEFSVPNVASGVYFYTLTAGEFSSTKKMVVMK